MICSARHVPKERTNTIALSKSEDWDSEDTVLESSGNMGHKNLSIRQH